MFMKHLNDFIEDSRLFDLPWLVMHMVHSAHGRIDRLLLSKDWLDAFGCEIIVGTRITSNYWPFILNSGVQEWGTCPSRFENSSSNIRH